MPDKRSARRAKQARRDARRAQTRAREEAEESPLVEEVRAALASGHPFDLLFLVSVIIQATTPRSTVLADPDDAEPLGLENLISSFIDVDELETTVLLAVLAEMVDDELLRIRCRNEVAVRGDEMPHWIAELGATRVDRAHRMSHVLGDGDEVLLSVQLPDGHAMTGAAFIDHAMMSEIGDAFFVPEPLDGVLDVARRGQADPDTTFVEMSLADARAWIEHGVDVHDFVLLPTESDTWPASRPLLAWLVRDLPDGGATYEPPGLEDAQLDRLLDTFFATPAAAPYSYPDYRELLELCIDDGTGDPLRWSDARLRRLLGTYMPLDEHRQIDVFLNLPGLLRAYVPFAHGERGIREELTAEAVAAIDEAEPDYREMVLEEIEDDDDL